MFRERLGYIVWGEEEIRMENIETILSVLDCSLETRRRRHIAGGILLSISLLFGGLAFTAMTLKSKENENEYQN